MLRLANTFLKHVPFVCVKCLVCVECLLNLVFIFKALVQPLTAPTSVLQNGGSLSPVTRRGVVLTYLLSLVIGSQ